MEDPVCKVVIMIILIAFAILGAFIYEATTGPTRRRVLMSIFLTVLLSVGILFAMAWTVEHF